MITTFDIKELVDYHFWYKRTSWLPHLNFRTKISKTSQCVPWTFFVKPQHSYLDFQHLTIFFQPHEYCWSRWTKSKENKKPVNLQNTWRKESRYICNCVFNHNSTLWCKFIQGFEKTFFKCATYTLYDVILRIARNLLESRENIKIESHSKKVSGPLDCSPVRKIWLFVT